MKRLFTYAVGVLLTLVAVSACWKEPQIQTGNDLKLRHQVTDLMAVAGDEEVQLSWSIPEGWNPTSYLITYLNTESKQEEITVEGGTTAYTVTGLVNGAKYTFGVQAVYDKLLSGIVYTKEMQPTTSRIPVGQLLADAESGKVTLYWDKPSTSVLGYIITCTPDGGETKSIEISDGNATSYVLEGLTDDINYTITIVAKYAKGNSSAASVKAMPSQSIPFFVKRDKVCIGQPVELTFNREDFPGATDVKWIFPGDIVVEGDTAKQGFASAGEKTVTLSAKVNGVEKNWTITIVVREYAVYDNDFAFDTGQLYNGFKGSAPMFSPDGNTIYDLTFNKITNLVAWDLQTGEKKWTYRVDHGSYNGLTVNPVTGDIYFGTQTAGDFFAVTANGELKWQFTEAGSMQSASPAVSKDGNTVYLIDAKGATFALDAATGAKKWQAELGGKGGGLLVNGNDLVVAVNSTAKTIVWLNALTGEEIVSYAQAGKASDISGGFAVSPDKRYAYYGHAEGMVSKIDLQERKIVVDCKVVSTADKPNIWGVVSSPNGDILAPSKDGNCYLLDGSTLEIKATLESGKGVNAFNYARACSDTEGNFYITSGQVQNTVWILGPDLSVKDQFELGTKNDKQMGGNNYLDGILYSAFIGAKNDNGKFIGKYVGGERYAAYGIDICGSCCLK